MTSRRRTRLRVPVLLTVALVPVGLLASACGPFGSKEDDGARKAADVVARALAGGDLSTLGYLAPDDLAAYDKLWKPLKSSTTKVAVEQVALAGDKATATLDWDVDVRGAHWKHSTDLPVVRVGGTWRATWQPSVVESSLVAGETLVVTGIKAKRADILGSGDRPIVEPRAVIRFGIDKSRAPKGADLGAAATRLAALVDVSAAPFVKQVTKAGAQAFVQAVVLRRADVPNRLIAGADAIPGGRAISDRLPLAPSKDFAAALLGTVGPVTEEIVKKSKGRLSAGDDAGLSGLQARYDEQLAGRSGVRVTAQSGKLDGAEGSARELFAQQPTAGTALKLTLDRTLQAKAQQLLTTYGPASALVAIKPSTGEILAAASGPGSEGYNTATFGQYAPGSTFKVVSSLALLRAGVKPTTVVDCPRTVVVNGKRFKNYDDYPGNRFGRITLRQAVANSCNTAFISERAKITGTALADAAAALGVGVDHDLGFPSYFGQVPAPASETEAAADLIGQGKVLASPMAMAAVAASVVHGSTVVPELIRDNDAVTPAKADPAKPLTKAEAAQLKTLMRAVVEEGSGGFLAALPGPPVIAKTGTAEYGTASGGKLPTHTWMIGAQGDLAVAVFVATGASGSATAGPTLEAFLRAAR
ncbi:MAG: penicillin-binding protein [Marmoricola sp.]|nr:penicillin-binding protein [Marmoricola sp.]